MRDLHAAQEFGGKGDSRAVHALTCNTDFLVVENDLLYFMHNNEWKLVVPRSLRESLMVEAHGGTTPRHFGVNRAVRRLHTAYYRPGMTTGLSVFCRACQVCGHAINPPRKHGAPLDTVWARFPLRVATD